MTDSVIFEDIVRAQLRLRDHAHETPIMTSRTLDELVGAEVFLKCENFQRIGAFKFRGAFNAISQLSDEEKGAWRAHLLVGQPRAGRGVGLQAPRDQGGHRHAGQCAGHQTRGHRRLRRDRGRIRSGGNRARRACSQHRGRPGLHGDSALRSPSRHCRTGHSGLRVVQGRSARWRCCCRRAAAAGC